MVTHIDGGTVSGSDNDSDRLFSTSNNGSNNSKLYTRIMKGNTHDQ